MPYSSQPVPLGGEVSPLITSNPGEPRAVQRHPIEFTGSGSEYFRIWIVNLLLTLVTFGLYYPWAKVRKLRYFYGNTHVAGHALDFHGDPKRMLRGFLLMAALFLAYNMALKVSPVAGGIDLAALNFRYRIAGDKVAWRPVRAFDDTRQLFIEFGEGVATGDMPPLFVIGGSGEAELVNYRVQGRYMIVDRLFERGELRLGAGKRARVVRIEREILRRGGRS